MAVTLKKLEEQVIVLTGASSGIGLVTARMAAKRGARLVLAARGEDALRRLTEEIEENGGQAAYVVADVGTEKDVHQIARVATERFGGFDTWINDAGVGIFGRVLDVTTKDHRRLFQTNYWGVVYGSLEAARHLRTRGGAIINIGSVVSDRVVPLQGVYSTSKHAVKGFTDALRMELEADDAPVSVTLIKPTSIDTPFTHHARNYLDEEPSLPPPVYAPELVAEAILHCCETPERDVVVGGGGKMIVTMEKYAPRLADKMMETRGFLHQEKSGEPPRHPEGALHGAGAALEERGGYPGMVRETSLTTQATLRPALAAALIGAATAIAIAIIKSRSSD
jgi:short-subunit dehydrogenase